MTYSSNFKEQSELSRYEDLKIVNLVNHQKLKRAFYQFSIKAICQRQNKPAQESFPIEE